MDNETKKYEIGFLLTSEDAQEKVVAILKKWKAEIIKTGQLARIKLAYQIKKETSAFFNYIHFSAESTVVKEIQDEIKADLQVLRFIIISLPAKEKTRKVFNKPVEEKKERPVEPTEIVSETDVKRPERRHRVGKSDKLTNEDLEKKLEEMLKE